MKNSFFYFAKENKIISKTRIMNVVTFAIVDKKYENTGRINEKIPHEDENDDAT